MPAGNDTRGIGQHISLIDSFSPRVDLPIDDRLFIDDISTINADIPEYIRYDGLIVYCLAQDTYVCYTNNEWRVVCLRYGFGDTDPVADALNTSFLNQDVYVNNVSGEMFRKVIEQADTSVDPLSIDWRTDVNLTGPQGEQGIKGDRGIRGSRWTAGTSITGTNTSSTVFPTSGINDALIGDQYLNTDNGNVYQCTADGDPSTAEWIYTGNIKGPQGIQGEPGQKGDTGDKGDKGDQGIPGSRVYTGVSIIGPTTDPIAFPNATDIANTDIAEYDYYVNQDTGHLYLATTSGKGNAVLWQRQMVFKGSLLYTGTGMNHDGTAKFDTGNIAYANVNDVYINLASGRVYMCTTEGDKDTALWTFKSTLASIPQVFDPADEQTAGTSGLVPAPSAGSYNRFLSSDGTWKEVDLTSQPGGEFTGPIEVPSIVVDGSTLTKEMVDYITSIMSGSGGSSGGTITVNTITIGGTTITQEMAEYIENLVNGDTITSTPSFNQITVGGVTLTQDMMNIIKALSDNNVDVSALLQRISTLENNYNSLSGTVSTMNNTLTSTTNTANTANSTANSALSKANSAATAASNAQNTANTANSTANTALTNANSAKSVTDKYATMLNIIGNGQ